MEINITITNQIGLHARPASIFVNTANKFKSVIWIVSDGRRANAKSILGVLSLGIGKDKPVRIIAEGEDAGQALTELKALAENNFGEI